MSSETLRLRDTLEGHGNWVTALATCDNVPDMIVSASRDKTLIVWQLTNSNDSTETFAVPKRSLHGHSHIVQDVALSHDGDYALSASWDKTLRLWNLNDGTSVRFVGHQGDVMSCAFTPDNLMVVSAGRDKTIRVWNVIGDEMYNIDGAQSHTDWVTGVRVAPSNEPKIVSAGCDKVVKTWDLRTCGLTTDFVGHHSAVSAITLSPDGSLCASGGKDGQVFIWDLNDSKFLYALPSNSEIFAFAFSPSRLWLAAATATGIKIYDLKERKVLEELRTNTFDEKEPKPLSLAWSPDGQVLYSGYDDDKLRVWQVMRAL